jgi:hypothetical protein
MCIRLSLMQLDFAKRLQAIPPKAESFAICTSTAPPKEQKLLPGIKICSSASRECIIEVSQLAESGTSCGEMNSAANFLLPFRGVLICVAMVAGMRGA